MDTNQEPDEFPTTSFLLQCNDSGDAADDEFSDCRSQLDAEDIPEDGRRPSWLNDWFPDGAEYAEVYMAEPALPTECGLVRGPDIAVDSGAAVPVANPKHFPGVEVRPSPGSLAGQKFVGPGGQTTPNQGQFNPSVILETGIEGGLNFQAADVRKPLLAVSAVNAKQNPVVFDGGASYILSKTCPQLKEIRRLIAEAPSKIPLHQEKGIYYMRTWNKPAPFQGQGR